MLGERQCLRPPGREPSGGGSGGGRLFWVRLADGLEGSPGSVGLRPPASGIPSAPLGPKRSSSGRWKICVTSAGSGCDVPAETMTTSRSSTASVLDGTFTASSSQSPPSGLDGASSSLRSASSGGDSSTSSFGSSRAALSPSDHEGSADGRFSGRNDPGGPLPPPPPRSSSSS